MAKKEALRWKMWGQPADAVQGASKIEPIAASPHIPLKSLEKEDASY